MKSCVSWLSVSNSDAVLQHSRNSSQAFGCWQLPMTTKTQGGLHKPICSFRETAIPEPSSLTQSSGLCVPPERQATSRALHLVTEQAVAVGVGTLANEVDEFVPAELELPNADVAPALLPMVNDCEVSLLQAATSSTLAPVTVKHVPGAFCGENCSGPDPPVKLKS